MPIDKQPKSSTTKPVTPALSARFRTQTIGLQPRLVGSAPTSPAVTARKDFRAQTLSSGVSTQPPPLSVNITPRSGTRNSRIGTESPATPVSLRRLSSNSVSQLGRTTSPGQSATGQSRLGTGNNVKTPPRTLSGSGNILKRDEQSARFVRAGEARPALVSSKSMANIGSRSRVDAFVRTVPPPPSSDLSPRSTTTKQNEDEGGKFVRANDVLKPPHLRSARPPLNTKLSSASAPAVRSRTPEASPIIPSIGPRLSPKKSGPLGLYRPASPQRTTITQPSFVTSPESPNNRRASIGTSSMTSRQNYANGHKKAASVSTVPQVIGANTPSAGRLATKEVAWMPPVVTHFPLQSTSNLLASPDTLSPRSGSLASSKTATTSVTSDTDHSEISRILLTPKDNSAETTKETAQLDVKSTSQSHAQVNAANARRERKVLDLEISNSSLLAINKTLERELKKQSTELRRFRRLSRAGRLSMAPTDRSVSAQSVLTTLTEHSEEEDEDPSSEEDDSDSEPSHLDDDDNSLLSNDSEAIRNHRRARDERRLMLDLSKHQQLLIDSQKMSTSIRKCLSFTEELIKEGKKALDYKVGIGDVKLGGRVLNNDDYETDTDIRGDEARSRKGLLSPSLTMTELHEATSWLGGIKSSSGGIGNSNANLFNSTHVNQSSETPD